MYDSACYDLAKNFLSDEEWAKESDIENLAQEIQDAIEDYIAGNRPMEEEDDESDKR